MVVKVSWSSSSMHVGEYCKWMIMLTDDFSFYSTWLLPTALERRYIILHLPGDPSHLPWTFRGYSVSWSYAPRQKQKGSHVAGSTNCNFFLSFCVAVLWQHQQHMHQFLITLSISAWLAVPTVAMKQERTSLSIKFFKDHWPTYLLKSRFNTRSILRTKSSKYEYRHWVSHEL